VKPADEPDEGVDNRTHAPGETGYGHSVDIDDPASYTTDRFEVLAKVDEALDIFEHADAKYPFVFGDGERAQAWLVYGRSYDQMARALAWVEADEALAADPENEELQAAYDATAESALHFDRPGDMLGQLRTLTPQEFVAAVPELTERIRANDLDPVAVGRQGTPEAVLVTHDLYRDLVQAHMRWHQSPPFLASLDPTVHKPMDKSRRVDLDEYFNSLGPRTAELWAQIKREEDDEDRADE
jgi:PHD/YefM family antitoxin component YafN of YafNO toxin-antitoxin module